MLLLITACLICLSAPGAGAQAFPSQPPAPEAGQYYPPDNWDWQDSLQNGLRLCLWRGYSYFTDSKNIVKLAIPNAEVKPFSEELAAVKPNGGLWGYIDKNGKQTIVPAYKTAGPFSNSLAVVENDAGTGVINTDGKVIIPFGVYDSIRSFKNHAARVQKGKIFGLINTGGLNIAAGEFNEIGEFFGGRAWVHQDYKYGYIDTLGQIVIPLIYTYADNFTGTLARVQQNNQYGYINKAGETIVPVIYDYLSGYKEGLAKAGILKKFGFIDSTGKMVIPAVFDYARSFSEGMAVVANAGPYIGANSSLSADANYYLFGYINKSGELIIPMMYFKASSFKNGRAHAVDEKSKHGFIDKNNNAVVPFEFGFIPWRDFYHGVIPASHRPKLHQHEMKNYLGLIDSFGRQILPEQYTYIQPFVNGRSLVTISKALGEETGMIDAKGNEILPVKFPVITNCQKGLYHLTYNNTSEPFTINRNFQTLLNNLPAEVIDFVPRLDGVQLSAGHHYHSSKPLQPVQYIYLLGYPSAYLNHTMRDDKFRDPAIPYFRQDGYFNHVPAP
ncbi:MAG: WG repeat-containing protein [Bacteroidota bacterium]